MTAEIISIGDELLIGQTQNTNAGWIGEQLALQGIELKRVVTIGDRREAILEAIEEGFAKSDLLITTGGLGPTKDDITKTCLCEYFETELVMHAELAQSITGRFLRTGRSVPHEVLQQAALPAACEVLPNTRGTASGMWFEKSGKVLISLPGVPHEMIGILSDNGFEKIRQRFSPMAIVHQTVLTQGIGESRLAEIIETWESDLRGQGFGLAYLPSAGMVKLRVTAKGPMANLTQLELEVAQRIESLKDLIPQYIFGYNRDTLAGVLGNLLREAGKTVATAESCTGGQIAASITSVPGASEYFLGSVVAYSTAIKKNVLGIDDGILEHYGATSAVVAEHMAAACRKQMGADFAIATTGIAGPGGGTDACPVGTIFMSVAGAKNVKSRALHYGHNRSRNIAMATNEALNWLRKEIIAGGLE